MIEIAMRDGRDVRRQEQAAVRHARERLDCALNVGGVLDRSGHKFDRERRRRGLGRSHEIVIDGTLRVAHQSSARQDAARSP